MTNKKTRIVPRFVLPGLLLIMMSAGSLPAQDPPARHAWSMDTDYKGPHQTAFQQLRWSIPNLIRQTTLQVAVRLGLDFQEGWRYPLTVGFVDGSPMGVENALAYVQLSWRGTGFEQHLNINLDAYQKHQFNFEKVFAHELVHAMVNDAIGGEAAMLLPIWFHEGVAVFGADQGEGLLRAYVHQHYGFAESALLNGLEGPHGALDYAEDYLAMKYLYENVGSNAFRNFVKEVISRRGDIPGALEYTCFLKWDDFKAKAMEYSKEQIRRVPPPRQGDQQKAY